MTQAGHKLAAHPVRTQARALIEHAGHIALVRVHRKGLERWVLPGGGQDAGEPLQATVHRECHEELGLLVQVGPLCLVREFVPRNHDPARQPFDVQCIDFVFRCTVHTDAATPLHALALGDGASQPDDEAVEARWLTLDAALALPLYPECLREWLPRMLAEDRVHYVGDAL
jgi:8-oxo-dGTP pyrophosphatase MutT (NUDIX family)